MRVILLVEKSTSLHFRWRSHSFLCPRHHARQAKVRLPPAVRQNRESCKTGWPEHGLQHPVKSSSGSFGSWLPGCLGPTGRSPDPKFGILGGVMSLPTAAPHNLAAKREESPGQDRFQVVDGRRSGLAGDLLGWVVTLFGASHFGGLA